MPSHSQLTKTRLASMRKGELKYGSTLPSRKITHSKVGLAMMSIWWSDKFSISLKRARICKQFRWISLRFINIWRQGSIQTDWHSNSWRIGSSNTPKLIIEVKFRDSSELSKQSEEFRTFFIGAETIKLTAIQTVGIGWLNLWDCNKKEVVLISMKVQLTKNWDKMESCRSKPTHINQEYHHNKTFILNQTVILMLNCPKHSFIRLNLKFILQLLRLKNKGRWLRSSKHSFQHQGAYHQIRSFQTIKFNRLRSQWSPMLSFKIEIH